MKKLTENVIIFDGEAVPFLSLPFTTRMTIVRLKNGDLWVHSPIKLTQHIQAEIATLGAVKYLIAPNHLHHLFLAEWQATYPDATSYGTDEVIKKRADLVFTDSLNKVQPWPWSEEIEQLMFTGSALMQECVFFDKRSRTLIVTDLVENFPGEDFNYWQRLIAKAVGIVAPNGKMPLDWRLSFMFSKAQARGHLSNILAWKPQAIVMAHGIIIDQEALTFLKKSFSWLG